MDTLRGRLLVATPSITGGPFWRSVVYLLEHGDDGALGVILNRPLNALVADVLPDWGGIVSEPMRLFDGGPVGGDAALAVAVVMRNQDDATMAKAKVEVLLPSEDPR